MLLQKLLQARNEEAKRTQKILLSKLIRIDRIGFIENRHNHVYQVHVIGRKPAALT